MMTTPHVPMVPIVTTRTSSSAASAERTLPLVSVSVAADARGGMARVTLAQTFRNPNDVALNVTYVFPLPEDSAVSAYAFTVGTTRTVGEIDRRSAARERFEDAILEGKTAALLEEDRTTLFTQEIGNVPAGGEVTIELVLDQRLVWTNDGAWEWRFPTSAAPRYLGSEGRVPDAARVAIDVAEGPLAVRASLALHVRDAIAKDAKPESPSHKVVTSDRMGAAFVALEDAGGAALDRDLVVRWAVDLAAGVSIDVARPREGKGYAASAYGLVTIVPPSRKPGKMGLPRDLVVLLDTSGSMGGAPLDQARRIVSALIDTLDDRDRLELIEFSSAPRSWKKTAVAATAANRKEALAWLASLQASGGTEMRDGILAALTAIRSESQRQVILVTDGQIGFEQEVVAAIFARLPSGACLHTVGVGSAVNRSLTSAAARAGRGTEVIVGLGEDPERAARRIVARTEAPLVVDVTIEGDAVIACVPEKRPGLHAATPFLAAVKLRPEGGELVVRGRTEDGTWEQRARVPSCAFDRGSQGVVALFGRELVLDLDMQRAAGLKIGENVDREIETIGLEFQIATRLTSWVAIAEEASIDPSMPTRRVRMPQALPYGMSAAGLGLRGAPPMPMAMMRASFGAPPAMAAPAPARAPAAEAKTRVLAIPSMPRSMPAPQSPRGLIERAAGIVKGFFESTPDDPALPPDPKRPLFGRVVQRKGDVLVIEILVEGRDVAWAPAKEARITWDDGSETRAAITREPPAGTIAAGESFRLFLRLDAADVARVHGIPCTLSLHDGTRHEVMTVTF